MNWIFSKNDYRSVILEMIARSGDLHGYRSALAKAAGCQSAYFSQVMKGQVQLTPEHASGLIDFWKLTGTEGDYFMILLHIDRAGSDSLRQKLERQRQELLKKAHRFSKEPVDDSESLRDAALSYYSNWLNAAVHMLVSIDRYQTAEAITRKLRVDPMRVVSALQELEKGGLIERSDAGWRQVHRLLHLEKSPQLTRLFHQEWRKHCLAKVDNPSDQDFHFTVNCTLSQIDFERVKEILKNATEESRKIVEPSSPEVPATMLIDFYRF